MARYVIEVPHDPDTVACARVVQIFLTSGSHYLTNAEWGCRDGVHSSWMIVDVDSKEEALGVLPPMLRHGARIVRVGRFRLDDIEATLRAHAAKSGDPEATSRG